jgi:glycosyltransferase involved in cell wall biosynthesis
MSGDAVLWISGRFDGCWWYRCDLPRRWLLARGHDVRAVEGEGGQDVGHIDDIGCMVLQRTNNRSTTEQGLLALMRALRGRGVPVYYEIDDDLWNNSFLKEGGPFFLPRGARRALMRDVERILERCSGVIVTGEGLATKVRRFNRHVQIIPNAVPTELCDLEARPAHEGVRIGWSGSNSHGREGDFAQALPALRRVLEARPEVQLVFLGWWPPEVEQWPRTECRVWGPIHDYYARLAAMDLDIFIAPLVDSVFNRGKSPSKLLEAGALGWAIVTEPHGPYRNVLQDDCTALIASTTADWDAALLRLVDEPATRRRLGEAARAYVRHNHTMEQTGPLWEQLLLGARTAVPA